MDHLQFGLAEILDQLAGLVRRRLAVARGLDHLAAPLGFLAQGNEPFHAGVCRAARLRRTAGLSACDRWRGSAIEDRAAGNADLSRRSSSAVHRRKRRSVRRRGALVGQWRRKRSLRKDLARVKAHDGSGQRHNQAADHQGWFSGKVRQAPTCSERSRFAMAFYDSCRRLTTRRLGQQRGAGRP